jgi:ABC-type nitrate/sulfonate/bicarbonate transport system ATPase subunit
VKSVELRNISHTFASGRSGRGLPDLKVLDQIDLAIEPGWFTAFIGPSGAGKSTLFNVITGLIKPDQGQVLISGEQVTGKTGHVAYMPQKDLLLPWRNVIRNATAGLEALGTPVAEAAERAQEMLGLFGLEGFDEAYPGTLSGGMRQRVALLRTVLLDKPVLALDEPFGALDALTRRQMQLWLAELRTRLGKTILFITHDIEEALFLSDEIVVLSNRPARILRRFTVPEGIGSMDDPLFIKTRKELLDSLKEAERP